MRSVAPALLLSVSLFGATNEVTLRDLINGTQTNRPITISRVFKQGEFASGSYPRPSIGGVPPTQWQTNIKTTWPDGSVQHSLITFTTSFTANQSKIVSFVSDTQPCHLGNQATCDAAALDATAMLSFNSSNWDAQISATASGSATVRSATARAMVTAGKFTYWLKGPLVTEVIAEDASNTRSYDFGWTCSTNCTTTYSSATWTDDTTHKSLHPRFILRFYTGWAGVKIDYILENIWLEHLQDQRYTFTLKSGGSLGTTRKSATAFSHYLRTRWRYTFWDGSQPGSMKTDLNVAYLQDSRIIPKYRSNIQVGDGAIAMEKAVYDSSDCTPGGNCMMHYGMHDTGSRGEIGLFARWDLKYLFNSSANAETVMKGNNDASGGIPIHFRESNNTKLFDGVNPAIGHVLSIQARPNTNSYSTPGGADMPAVVAAPSASVQWDPEPEHVPLFGFIPYLASGDYYSLEELQYWAAWYADIYPNDTTSVQGRNGLCGYQNDHSETPRATAWGMRNIALASIMSPNGTLEKTYFGSIRDCNYAVVEGYMAITDGPYNGDSNWTWGRNTMAGGASNPLHMIPSNRTNTSNAYVDSTKACAHWAHWMGMYKLLVYGYLYETGYGDLSIYRAIARWYIHMIKDSTNIPSTPHMAAMFDAPASKVPASGTCAAEVVTGLPVGERHNWFSTWAEVGQAINSTGASTAIDSFNNDGNLGDFDGGWPLIMMGGVSSWVEPFTDGSLSGSGSQAAIEAQYTAAGKTVLDYIHGFGNGTADCTQFQLVGGGTYSQLINNCDNPKFGFSSRGLTGLDGSGSGNGPRTKISGKFKMSGSGRIH